MSGRWRGPIFSKSARPLTRTPSPITSNTGIALLWAVSSTRRRRQPHRAPFRSRERSIAPPGTTISRSPTFRGRGPFLADNFSSQIYGSAAADWARWPAGTIFRVLSTGQLYRVEDYGWALSGRNTIDLYMATPREMNGWGVRRSRSRSCSGAIRRKVFAGSCDTPNTATSSGWCWSWKGTSGPRPISN